MNKSQKLLIKIITLFPPFIDSFTEAFGILKKAVVNKLLEITPVDLRSFGIGDRQIVDDRPYGVGSMVGSLITYWIGMYGGRPLIERYGKYVLISSRDLDIADRFFYKYGSWSTFIGRLLPVVRTFISIPAGIARVEIWKFLFFSFLGSFIWTYILAYVGMKLGENWHTLRDKLHGFDTVIIVLIVVGVVYWIYRHFRNKKNA